MRILIITIIAAMQLAFTGVATAQEPGSEEFGAAVRAYLLEHPEVIMEAIDVLERRQAEAETANDEILVQTNFEELFYDGFSHVTGNLDGEILIVEFQDYKCGYCKRAHIEVQQLLADNPDIRLVVKEFPILGEESILASRAAVAVLINETPEIYDIMNDNVMRFNGPLNMDTLVEMAEQSGANIDNMLDTMASREVTEIIQANRLLGQKMRISGTPTFVIGGQMLRGYLPAAGMQVMVDQARNALN